jgi:hypothetical protein
MRRGVRALCLCLSVIPSSTLAAAPAPKSPDWPCRQILVSHLSKAAVWSGPSTEGVAWRDDPDVSDLAARLAARRLPIDQAKKEVDAFAQKLGDSKKTKLTALFVALFDKLDEERAEVIAGLERFGHGQKLMADRIRAENEKVQSSQNAAQSAPQATPNETPQSGPFAPATSPPSQATAPQTPVEAQRPPETASPIEKLQWDVRLFDERRQTLNYVCDVPTMIEQRLFALAREIQNQID